MYKQKACTCLLRTTCSLISAVLQTCDIHTLLQIQATLRCFSFIQSLISQPKGQKSEVSKSIFQICESHVTETLIQSLRVYRPSTFSIKNNAASSVQQLHIFLRSNLEVPIFTSGGLFNKRSTCSCLMFLTFTKMVLLPW